MAAGDLRLEVWRRPGAAVFERLVEQIPGPFNFTKRMAGGVGQGDITVPATWDRINDVITRVPGTPSSDVRTLNRVLMEQASGVALVKYEWFNDVTGDESREDFTQIQGAGIESIMADGIIYPWDWDGLDESTSTFPDWIWGGKDVVGPVMTSFAPHIFDAWISTGATGTFDIDVSLNGGAFESATVAPGDTAATVEIAIEGLTNVTAADVQGNGTEESPWRISITEPAGTWTIAIDSSGLSGGRGFQNLDQFGKLMPIGWTQSLVGSTNVPHGILTDFRASLGGGADPTLPAGCDAWIVFLGQEWYFPGVQKRIRVTPGAPFQIPDDYIILYAQGANADVRLIVRDLFEQEICSIELSLVSNTLTPVPGFSCLIPLGITEVVFRLGHIGEGTPPRIFMACPSMREGLAPTTAGGIMEALMDDAILNHIADGRLVWENLASVGTSYIAPTYSVTLDSDGVTWDEDELTFTAQRGKSYLQVLTDLNHLGYKWTVTAGATGSWNLNLYNPDWVDTDATTLSTPAINIGSGVTGGPIFRSHMTGNVITVEGSQMQFGRSASSTSVTSIGRREAYQPDRSLMNMQMASLRAAEEVASRLLSGLSVSVTVDPVNGPVPLLDYDVDWQLNVQIPPILQKSAHRLASITVSVGEITQYKLAFSSESFAGVQGVIEGVRRLMLKFEGLERPINEDIPTPVVGGGGMATVAVAAADSTIESKRKADLICSGSNDQDTIQLAINMIVAQLDASSAQSGGRVWLYEGTYKIRVPASPGILVQSRITVEGLNPDAVNIQIQQNEAAGRYVFQLASGAQLRSVSIQQVGGLTGSLMPAAVKMTGGDTLVENCRFVQIGGGSATAATVFAGNGLINQHVVGCEFDQTYGDAVVLHGVEHGGVTRCRIRDNSGNGVLLMGACNGVVVAHNQFRQCESNGIGVGGSGHEGFIFADNDIEAVEDDGISVGGNSSYYTISGNTIREPLRHGIWLQGTQYGTVVGNLLYSVARHGIYLDDNDESVISSNDIIWPSQETDNTYDGIFIEDDSDRNLITANKIVGLAAVSPQYGINIDTTDCDDNIYVGNSVGPAAGIGTAAYRDNGTGTQNVYPGAAAPQGDNFLI